MTQRPLPKTVMPLADELLSGWLMRLAVTNHCEVDELLAHIEVETRQAAMLDFDVELAAATAEKVSIAARVEPETVKSLSFGEMTQAEALMTAQVRSKRVPTAPDAASRSNIGGRHGHLTAKFAACGFIQSSSSLMAIEYPKNCFVVRDAEQGCSKMR